VLRTSLKSSSNIEITPARAWKLAWQARRLKRGGKYHEKLGKHQLVHLVEQTLYEQIE